MLLAKLCLWGAALAAALGTTSALLLKTLTVLGLLSVLVGAVLLTGQSTVRGFIAASGIYNMGFAVAALGCGPLGVAVGLVFAVWYAFTMLFFIYNCLKFRIGPVSAKGYQEIVAPYYLLHFAGFAQAGQFSAHSLYAVSLLLLDFMALPPLPGFIFKFNIIFLLVTTTLTSPFGTMALTAVFTAALPATLFCYFRLLKLSWFDGSLPHVRTLGVFEYKVPVLRLLGGLFAAGFLLSSAAVAPFCVRLLYRLAGF